MEGSLKTQAFQSLPWGKKLESRFFKLFKELSMDRLPKIGF